MSLMMLDYEVWMKRSISWFETLACVCVKMIHTRVHTDLNILNVHTRKNSEKPKQANCKFLGLTPWLSQNFCLSLSTQTALVTQNIFYVFKSCQLKEIHCCSMRFVYLYLYICKCCSGKPTLDQVTIKTLLESFEKNIQYFAYQGGRPCNECILLLMLLEKFWRNVDKSVSARLLLT